MNNNLMDDIRIEVSNEIINNMKSKFHILKSEKEDSCNELKEDIEIINKVLKLIEKQKKEPDMLKKEKLYKELLKINKLGVNEQSIIKIKEMGTPN